MSDTANPDRPGDPGTSTAPAASTASTASDVDTDGHDGPATIATAVPVDVAASGPGNDSDGSVATGELEPPTAVDPASGTDAIALLTRRMNLLIGLLAVLLVGAFVVIGLLFARVADAEADAGAARAELAALAAGGGSIATAADLEVIRDDLERVEAGAALYASQIEGFQEQITELAPSVSEGVDEAIAGLRRFGESTIAFDVNIDEVIPIDTEVVIRRTVAVPIRTTIPIEESFDTTIRIDTPFGDIPLDVNVPVDVDVPVDLVVDIPIDETVPIEDEFPVQLDVPIAIDVADTELKNLTDSLAAGLESLREVLIGLGN